MSCRESYTFPVTIPNGTALSNTIDFREQAYAIVHMPAAWDAANIGFQVSSELNGTFLPLYDDGGAIVEIAGPAVDQAHAVPVEVLAARFVKLWSQTAGADTNQTATRSLIIDMKS